MSGLASEIAWSVASTVRPLLTSRIGLESSSAVTLDKGDEHLAHRIDAVAESALFESLRRLSYRGKVFSEESGLVSLGRDERIVVCDPYCNTSLTFRGVRESAVAVHEFSSSNSLLSTAIVDLQIPRMVCSRASGHAHVLWPGEAYDGIGHVSGVSSVSDALVVIPLLKVRRRRSLPLPLLCAPRTVVGVDGAIVSLRIAVGEFDGFIDSHVGQPTYEALAYVLVPAAGGYVADATGAPLDFADLVSHLRKGDVGRHQLVAAGTRGLLSELVTLARARE